MQADLNGDGKPEIIAASPTGTLKVLAARHSGDGFAQAQLLSGNFFSLPLDYCHLDVF